MITGSNRVIGLAFAQHYSAAGWHVIATARDPQGATELQELTIKDRGQPINYDGKVIPG